MRKGGLCFLLVDGEMQVGGGRVGALALGLSLSVSPNASYTKEASENTSVFSQVSRMRFLTCTLS